VSDLKEQLRKAGLVSEKRLRQVKHEERLHASEVGREGLAAERQEQEERLRQEEKARRQGDRAREQERKSKAAQHAATERLAQILTRGWIRDATVGTRRFFFVTREGRITFLDLADLAAIRLGSGTAAIVETGGAVRGAFCVIQETAAEQLAQIDPERIRFWNRRRERGIRDPG